MVVSSLSCADSWAISPRRDIGEGPFGGGTCLQKRRIRLSRIEGGETGEVRLTRRRAMETPARSQDQIVSASACREIADQITKRGRLAARGATQDAESSARVAPSEVPRPVIVRLP